MRRLIHPFSRTSVTCVSDPFAWLEDVDSDEALAWVRERNGERAAELAAGAGFAALQERILGILDSRDKIPSVSKIGEHYYNFWRDEDHERGLWRRTSPESYASEDPDWEVVLDLDELGRVEGENWVWHGASVLRGAGEYRLALVSLSRGGSDADVTREFDLVAKDWVEGGFHRPESKGGMGWIDADTAFVYTDTGPGSMTASGYPRLARRWTRGTDLAAAPIVYEGTPEDMYVAALHDSTPGFERDLVVRTIDFYSSEAFLLAGGRLTKIDVPDSAEIDLHREWLTVELREEWAPGGEAGAPVHAAGSLLAIPLEDFLAGARDFRVIFAPTPATALVGAAWTRSHLVVNVLEDVKTRLHVWTPTGGAFVRGEFPGVPDVGTVGVRPVDEKFSDDVWVVTTDFLTPTTLQLATVGGAPSPLKSQPRFFDASDLVTTQRFTRSADGTRVPYFLIHRREMPLDGSTPTLLYGYGGFEISLTPSYSGVLGAAWLERGGAYALANIRGGGEYGPTWHQGALRENRHRAYEDFAAVARDLVASGLTSREHLGIQGGSNGGLLTGNMLTGYPELFGAVVIQVPLLDLKRYSHLLAGASWIAEYGDPDTDDWEFMESFSPYHQIDPERAYPPVLLTTSTRDDRVHPAHARKFAAALAAAGQDVTYFENVEGGHGGAATNAQAAHMAALAYEFLATRLGPV
ncbi:prolyl oligopeptidase family serine peptidase [Pseudactinotalea sp. HY160]|nr:prolyl oligopeptidase family serine peptidase [Pseudactinotalea sp. HY160]